MYEKLQYIAGTHATNLMKILLCFQVKENLNLVLARSPSTQHNKTTQYVNSDALQRVLASENDKNLAFRYAFGKDRFPKLNIE